jgi:hypothetical protein
MKTTTIAKLKIGQRFSFIPSAWHGPCRLTEKHERIEYEPVWKGDMMQFPMKKVYKYDIKFNSNVVNPPGVDYGVPGDLRVRLLSSKPQRSRKGHRAGYVV